MVMTIVWPWRSTSASGIERLPLPESLAEVAGPAYSATQLLAPAQVTRTLGEPVRTPICDRLGIELPIFAFSHCRDVVAAVSKAGGYGVLGALAYAPDQLEIELSWIDEHVEACRTGSTSPCPPGTWARAEEPRRA